MPKYLEITGCEQCIYFRDIKGGECTHGKRPKILRLDLLIPFDCPLPNAPQEGAHCADTPKETSIMEDMGELKWILDTQSNKV